MNRIQAINYLKSSGFSNEQIKAIKGAFTCEDAISRQAVLDCQHFIYDETGEELEVILAENVLNLPSVTPQPKTGTWIECSDESGKWYECDQCHTDWGGPVNYCPNCGAKM